jgi:hypothetical protein
MHRAPSRALVQNVVHTIPEGLIYDPFMLARMGNALVDGLAHVNAVVENPIDVALVDRLAALRRHSFRPQDDDELRH